MTFRQAEPQTPPQRIPDFDRLAWSWTRAEVGDLIVYRKEDGGEPNLRDPDLDAGIVTLTDASTRIVQFCAYSDGQHRSRTFGEYAVLLGF